MPEKIENIIVHGLKCINNSFFFVFSSPLRNNYSIHAQLGAAYKHALIIHEHQSCLTLVRVVSPTPPFLLY